MATDPRLQVSGTEPGEYVEPDPVSGDADAGGGWVRLGPHRVAHVEVRVAGQFLYTGAESLTVELWENSVGANDGNEVLIASSPPIDRGMVIDVPAGTYVAPRRTIFETGDGGWIKARYTVSGNPAAEGVSVVLRPSGERVRRSGR